MLDLYFNNKKIPHWIKVTDIREDILPSFDSDKYQTKFKNKKIIISYKFNRNKLIDLNKRAELINWVKGDNFQESKLILPGRQEYYYLAKVSDLSDIAGSIKKGQGTIEFTCYKTEYISSVEYRHMLNNNKPFKIIYSGDIDVYPKIIFKIKSQCNKIKLNFRNYKMNNFIEFNHSFNANDVLELNQETNKVLLNNSNVNMQIWHLLSKRNKLTNGENTYTLETSNVEVEIIYNSKFL